MPCSEVMFQTEMFCLGHSGPFSGSGRTHPCIHTLRCATFLPLARLLSLACSCSATAPAFDAATPPDVKSSGFSHEGAAQRLAPADHLSDGLLKRPDSFDRYMMTKDVSGPPCPQRLCSAAAHAGWAAPGGTMMINRPRPRSLNPGSGSSSCLLLIDEPVRNGASTAQWVFGGVTVKPPLKWMATR